MDAIGGDGRHVVEQKQNSLKSSVFSRERNVAEKSGKICDIFSIKGCDQGTYVGSCGSNAIGPERRVIAESYKLKFLSNDYTYLLFFSMFSDVDELQSAYRCRFYIYIYI